MATGAGIQIETRAETIGNGFHFREHWNTVVGEEIEFAGGQASDGLAGARRAAADTGISGLSLRDESRE
jgi:hypothetical protein